MQKWVIKNVETVEKKEEKNTEQDAMNAYLPTANPYFSPYPTYPNYPPMSNMPQAGNAQGAQMPTAYFPPYPYFPPYAPYPCANGQCKKEN